MLQYATPLVAGPSKHVSTVTELITTFGSAMCTRVHGFVTVSLTGQWFADYNVHWPCICTITKWSCMCTQWKGFLGMYCINTEPATHTATRVVKTESLLHINMSTVHTESPCQSPRWTKHADCLRWEQPWLVIAQHTQAKLYLTTFFMNGSQLYEQNTQQEE